MPIRLGHGVMHRLQVLAAGHSESTAGLEVDAHRQCLGGRIEVNRLHGAGRADPSAVSNSLSFI